MYQLWSCWYSPIYCQPALLPGYTASSAIVNQYLLSNAAPQPDRLYLCRALVHSRCKTLPFSVLKLNRFLLGPIPLSCVGPSEHQHCPQKHWMNPQIWHHAQTCWGRIVSSNRSPRKTDKDDVHRKYLLSMLQLSLFFYWSFSVHSPVEENLDEE